MITVTEAAQKELDSFFETNPENAKSIRVYVAPGGCCGPSLTMALDGANDMDATEVVGGVTYCMAKELYEQTGELGLDVSYMGFMLSAEHPLPGSGSCGSGGCGGGCGSGSCCH